MDDTHADRLDPRLAWQIRLLALATITLLWLWSNRAAFGEDPPAITLLHQDVPLPASPEGNVLLISPLYVASLNPDTKLCDWVQYRLTPGLLDTGNVLARNWRTGLREAALENADYTGSGYDRGHLVPLDSVSASPHAADVNRMEVIAPQTPALNRGVWFQLEELSREIVRREGELLVQVGTLYESDQPPLPAADEDHRVPSHFWLRLISPAGTQCFIVPQTAPQDALPEHYALDEKTLRGRVKLLR